MAAPESPPPAFVHALRLPQDPGTIRLVIGGRIERGDAQRLGDLVRGLLELSTADAGGIASLVVCDVDLIDRPDVAAVDLLCRIRVITRRMGHALEVRSASPELSELLGLIGLADVLPLAPSGLELEGQAEEREHPRRVEEERDPADPSA